MSDDKEGGLQSLLSHLLARGPKANDIPFLNPRFLIRETGTTDVTKGTCIKHTAHHVMCPRKG